MVYGFICHNFYPSDLKSILKVSKYIFFRELLLEFIKFKDVPKNKALSQKLFYQNIYTLEEK